MKLRILLEPVVADISHKMPRGADYSRDRRNGQRCFEKIQIG